MLPIGIDISDFVEQSSLSEDEVRGFTGLLLDRLAQGFQNEWMNQVSKSLHSTRAEYMKGMFIDRPNDNTIVFGVTRRKSPLAVDLELGKDAFDEKRGFSMSSKRTMKKGGGWFITVPFRHAVPTALGESSVFTSVMPVSVYKIARRQSTPITSSQLPSHLRRPGMRQAIQTKTGTIPAYFHKAAKYEGLVRVEDRDENRGTYLTFRRVSDLSDWNAFWHPGLLPRNLLGQSLNRIDISSIIRRAKVDYFKSR